MAKIKVSQKTIDNIKAMGMTKALKGAKSASPEMREALTRMYGARRVSAAGGSSKPAVKSADAARAAAMKPKGTTYKSADAARAAASKPAKGTVYKSADAARAAAVARAVNTSTRGGTAKQSLDAMKKPVAKPVKKSGTTDPFAKFVFGLGKKVAGGANNGMTAAQVAATNAKRMGISVAEYNKRMNAAKNK